MNLATKIACRTMGTVGIGLALYDSLRVGAHFARTGGAREQSTYLQRRYYDARTTDTVSYSSNAIREKTFDLLTKSPLPSIWGKIKGGIQGVLYGLGNCLIPIACSAFAILGKGIGAKLGAAGVALSICYKIAREGFGLGKRHPMD